MPFTLTADDIVSVAKDKLNIGQASTAFDTVSVEPTTNALDLSGTYTANTERYNLITAGTLDSFDENFEAVTEFNDVSNGFEITVNGTSGDLIHFESAEAPRYVPGFESLFALSLLIQSELEAGQVVRFGLASVDSNADIQDGYVYEITSDNRKLQIYAGGVVEKELQENGWDTNPYNTFNIDNTIPIVHRGFFNWYGVGSWRAVEDFTEDDESDQENITVAEISRNDDFVTEEINLNIFCQLECTSDTSAFTVKVGTMEYKVRGEGTSTTRAKRSQEFTVTGGSIGSIDIDGADDISDATAIKAVRVDPERDNVFTELVEFSAEPTDNMVIAAYAVHDDDTDATGWFTPQHQSVDNSIVEETKNVSTIPTITKDGQTRIKGRQLGLLQAKGGQGNTADERVTQAILNAFYPDETVLFVAYTESASGADTDLEYTTQQEW